MRFKSLQPKQLFLRVDICDVDFPLGATPNILVTPLQDA